MVYLLGSATLLKYILANTTINFHTDVIAFETRAQIEEDLFKNVDRWTARIYLLFKSFMMRGIFSLW
jgi:hypothetical protein